MSVKDPESELGSVGHVRLACRFLDSWLLVISSFDSTQDNAIRTFRTDFLGKYEVTVFCSNILLLIRVEKGRL